MFNEDFFPTPKEVIERMLFGYIIEGKVILEPSAGKGDIVDYLKINGAANVISCENNEDLRKILATKCSIICNDFLTVTSNMISHIDMMIMNPPFSVDEKHILHAYEIAPAGCVILSLCNFTTVDNPYTQERKRLKRIIEENGSYENWGDCFSNAERKTNVEIAFVKLQKPGVNYNTEFEGFYLSEEKEDQENGIMSYNFVRDLVNRYIGVVKIYDEQLEAAVKMNNLTSGFFSTKMGMTITENGKVVSRNEFKKEMQKAGWNFIFNKMNMQKYSTKGLKEDINKFVEKQTSVPFTMKNIYLMLEIVIGTAESRMDKAILEVFDKLTTHYHDNRFNVEGWKTNSNYLVNQKFILDWMVESNWGNGMRIKYSSSNAEKVEDFNKALCFITGRNYDEIGSMYNFFSRELPGNKYPREYMKFDFGVWYEFGFFKVKGYKKGTMHFEFLDTDVWGKFNQHVARLKGYPLFEYKEQTKWQKKQNKQAA